MVTKKDFKKWYKTKASRFQKEQLKTTNKIYKFKDGLYTAFICSNFYDEV
jgi:hypothetical protein